MTRQFMQALVRFSVTFHGKIYCRWKTKVRAVSLLLKKLKSVAPQRHFKIRMYSARRLATSSSRTPLCVDT